MKEKTADIDILEELIRDYKDEKEFVGEDIIKAIETLIAENKELKEINFRMAYNTIKNEESKLDNYIEKSKVEEIINKYKYTEIGDSEKIIQFYKELQSLLGKE